ncbi:MAG: hypothetical protein M1822_004579 [Bathelium mastoideum]|nr:MAG: hypothetical protein M1822_004579 [Bathelium mastoideum]
MPTATSMEKRQTSSSPSITTQYSQPNLISPANLTNTVSIQPPSCSQASIQPSLCSQLQANFEATYEEVENPAAAGNSTITSPPIASSTGWPASSILGPGCSVGCGGCAITGGTVQLLYWPVAETAAPENVTVTAHAFGTVFTSPTVYVSFASIYASDSCSAVGATYGPTIIPLEPAQLSSVWESYPNFMSAQTAAFNFTDLAGETLAPNVASRRPQCAVWLSSQYASASIYAPNTTCPGAYCGEPIIVVPSTFLQYIDPSWATCSHDIRGLYDPPTTLQAATVAAAPTPSPMWLAGDKTTAVPVSKPLAAQASPTAHAASKSGPSDPSKTGSSGNGSPNGSPSNSPTPNDPPSGDNPSGDSPSSDPHSSDPSSSDPHSSDPSSGDPSSSDPSSGDPSSSDPSSKDPSSSDPSSSGPPSNDPPSSGVPSNNPPANNPPSSNPPSNDPPSNSPPSNNPPSNNPPASGSPANEPSPNNAEPKSSSPTDSSQDPTAKGSSTNDPSSEDPSNVGAATGDDPSTGNSPSGGSGNHPENNPPSTQPTGVGATVASILNNPGPAQNSGDGSAGHSSGESGSGESPQNGGDPSGSQPSGHTTSGSGASGAGLSESSPGESSSSESHQNGGDPNGSQPSEQTTSGSGASGAGLSESSPGGSSSGHGAQGVNAGSGSQGNSNPDPPSGNSVAAEVGSILGTGGASDPSENGGTNKDPEGGSTIPTGNEAASAAASGGAPGAASNGAPGGATPGTTGESDGEIDVQSNTPDPAASAGDQPASSGSTDPDTAKNGGANEPASFATIATIGGQEIAYDPAKPNGVMVGSQYLAQGQTTNIAGSPISVGPSGVVFGGSSTVAFDRADPSGQPPSTPIATIGNDPVLVDPTNSGALIIGSQTLGLGSVATIQGTPVSLGSAGLVFGTGSTFAWSSTNGIPSETAAPSAAIFTLGSQKITAFESQGVATIGSHVLSVGGPAATISGATFSLQSSGIVIESGGSSTTNFFSVVATNAAQDAQNTGSIEVEAPFTVDGHQFTAYELAGDNGVAVIIGSNGVPITLTDGGAATTLDGQMISLGTDGIEYGVGSSTKLAPWSTVTGTNLPSQVSSIMKTGTGPAPGPWESSGAAATQTAGTSGARRRWVADDGLLAILSIWGVAFVAWCCL